MDLNNLVSSRSRTPKADGRGTLRSQSVGTEFTRHASKASNNRFCVLYGFSLRPLRLFFAPSAVKIFSDAKRQIPQKFSNIRSPALPDFSG
jgi:hypothetical protein